MASAAQPHLHALVLPFPLQGHISPLLQLSEHLAISHGFHITFVNTEYNHARLLKQANKILTSNNKNIKMVGVSDGLPLDAERTAADMRRVVESMPLHTMPLLEQLISDLSKQRDNSITCIIADIFLPWAHDLAKRCNISAFIGFHASSIAQFSFLYHIPLLVSTGQLNPDGTARDGNREKLLTGIPGVLDVPLSCAPWHFEDAVRAESTFRVLASVGANVENLDCLLFNSFAEIEEDALGALVKKSRAKMAAVGPMLLLDSSTGNIVKPPCSTKVTSTAESRSGLQLDQERDACLHWLDDKAPHSVLYIAFGTTARVSVEELLMLARGIELSAVPFLWVLPPDLLNGTGSGSTLPHDFLEKTKQRAYFTAWAPQTMILSHPAIGAFLTHGGWNSTLEAISLGVPMLLWPSFWDQKFHTEQVVEQWKVGLRLQSSTQSMSTTMIMESMSSSANSVMDLKQAEQPWGLSAEEVERLVRCVMRGEEGEQMRERAATMKDKAKLAVAKGSGSSYHNLQDVIRLVEAKLRFRAFLASFLPK